MDDPLFVGLLERVRDLQRDREAFGQGQRPRFEALGEGRAGDELHDERVRFAAGLDAIDLRDVRVVELRQQLRLALEARETLLVLGERCRQDLDRDFALEPRVVRAVDLAHAAFAQLGGDLVGTDSLADQGRDLIRPGLQGCDCEVGGRSQPTRISTWRFAGTSVRRVTRAIRPPGPVS